METSPASNTRAALRDLMNDSCNSSTHSEATHDPTPSPEEQLIQQRGRRQTELALKSNALLLTPPKVTRPARHAYSTPTRTSPRKRLNMNSNEQSTSTSPLTPPETPNGNDKVTPQGTKRIRYQNKQSHTNLNTRLKALTSNQLIDLVVEITNKYPHIKADIADSIPIPDINPLEERLKYLEKNILKSFPSSRWGTKYDAFCYRRVSTHIEAFKKDCIAQARQLIDSEQWPSVSEYILIALTYVDNLPDWDNPGHNKLKQQMFKVLSSHLFNSIKKNSGELEFLEDSYSRLKKLKDSSQSLMPCLKYLKEKISN